VWSLRPLVLGLAAAALLAPASALPQAVGGGVFTAKNNSSAQLRCRYRIDDQAWGKYFRLRPGAELQLDRRPGMEVVYLFCDPPVRRVTYLLRAGERHSLLRADDGAIELRSITTGT
jgi:hypothetical protein